MSNLVDQAHDAIRELFNTVDQIVAVCEWVRDVLIRNDVPSSKITVSRQGLPQDESNEKPSWKKDDTDLEPIPSDEFSEERPLRLIFLGRLDSTKGLHVVIRALQQIPEAPIRLDVYGVTQGESEYVNTIQELASKDSRVTWCDPVSSEEVPDRIRGHDVLVAPSQWLETGPLVVYEAFAAGRPVVGSDLGGISELVTDGTDGLLVEPSEPQKWAKVIRSLALDSTILKDLKRGVTPPRKMKDVARDMLSCYQELFA
jgi:glycosyltransferase involved in cell wall biosynthesis